MSYFKINKLKKKIEGRGLKALVDCPLKTFFFVFLRLPLPVSVDPVDDAVLLPGALVVRHAGLGSTEKSLELIIINF